MNNKCVTRLRVDAIFFCAQHQHLVFSSTEFAADSFRAERELVERACKQSAGALSWAAENLRADKALVETACKESASALTWAAEELRTDKVFVMHVLEDIIDAHASFFSHLWERTGVMDAFFQSIAPSLQADRDIILAVLLRDGRALGVMESWGGNGLIQTNCKHGNFRSFQMIGFYQTICSAYEHVTFLHSSDRMCRGAVIGIGKWSESSVQ